MLGKKKLQFLYRFWVMPWVERSARLSPHPALMLPPVLQTLTGKGGPLKQICP